MKEDNRSHVVALLEEYRVNIRKIAQLRYELDHPMTVSPAEMIDAMSFGKGAGEGRPSPGYVSNKTLYIAMNYQEKAAQLNNENREDIVGRLVPLERAVDRLEFYVGLLTEKQAVIIRRHYFDGASMEALAAEMQMSPKTLRKVKNEAIEALTEMYEYAGQPA